MDLWERARVFAEEAAKRSSEIAAEAAKRADDALRAAAHIKTLASAAAADIPIPIPPLASAAFGSDAAAADEPDPDSAADLERFGITEELTEYVKGIALSTFKDFPMEDVPEMTEVRTVSNVRQDLNEWQARHATLVLSTVKEISKFRYELCPRYMKERKFWRIYFVLVDSYVALYEKRYMEELKMNSEQNKGDMLKESSLITRATKTETKDAKLQNKTSASSKAEFDLDVFLLGDLASGDEGSDGGDEGLDDDFDKIGKNSVADGNSKDSET